MAVSLVGSNTNFSGTTGTPSVPLPAGVQSGDVLIAAMVYAAADQPVTTPTGWTAVDADLHMTGNGTVSVIWKRAGVSEATPTWTLGTGAAVTSKSADAIVAYRGAGDPVFGARVVRTVSGTTTVAPSVTAAAGSVVVGIFMDRVSSQTTVTKPAEQDQRAMYINGGGGGVSILISDETRASAGATGTRTATYGIASTAAYGVLAEVAAASNLPPSVSAGASQTVSAGSTVTLTGTAADSDGTIASRQWTAVSYPGATAPTITGATSNTATFAATPSGTYVFRFAATDNGGATGTSTVTVYVTATTVTPDRVTANTGGYVSVGGAASIQAAVSDSSDATYAESPAAPSAASIALGLPALANSTQLQVTTRLQVSAASPAVTCTVDVLQGSTVIATRTTTPTTAWSDFVFTLTEAETAAITDRTALAVRVSSTQAAA